MKNKKNLYKTHKRDQGPCKNQADLIFSRSNILWQEAMEPYLEGSLERVSHSTYFQGTCPPHIKSTQTSFLQIKYSKDMVTVNPLGNLDNLGILRGGLGLQHVGTGCKGYTPHANDAVDTTQEGEEKEGGVKKVRSLLQLLSLGAKGIHLEQKTMSNW